MCICECVCVRHTVRWVKDCQTLRVFEETEYKCESTQALWKRGLPAVLRLSLQVQSVIYKNAEHDLKMSVFGCCEICKQIGFTLIVTKTFLLFCCSEGVFKCPEDQLPLDYAKVRVTPHTAHMWWSKRCLLSTFSNTLSCLVALR